MNPPAILKKAALSALTGMAFIVGTSDLAAAPDPHPSKPARPNFVFFITDDISPDDLGPYGNTRVSTPNLDDLASEALVFENAYLTISSCSPSRCSIITGRYPHNTGAPELHTTLPEDQLTFVSLLKDSGYHTVLSGKNHMGPAERLGFVESSGSGPSGSEKWVKHLKERPADRPFFMWFASHDAHYSFQINDLAPVYDPSEVEVPPMLADGPLTREALAGYFHEVSRTDYYAGRILEELEGQGIRSQTYFIYCSDNGRPFPRCKTYLYDSGIRTPLIIAGPFVRAGRTSSIVSSIDFPATILDLAGIDKPESIQGVSFREVLGNHQAVTRTVAFAERNWHVFQNHARAVRTGDWLYIWNAWPERHNLCGESSNYKYGWVRELWEAAGEGRLTPAQALLTVAPQPEEMLFHVRQDPYQFFNLAGDPAFAAELTRLRNLLSQWVDETGDSVPVSPTPDRQPIHENRHFPDFKRGEFAGASRNATTVNHPGPVMVTP